jgi:cyclophilin family peptidyl-prolyl cis-trans isomerase
MWSATARIRSGSATEVPPYFWTRRATAFQATGGSEVTRKGFPAAVACFAVPAADKRQRKKENARMAREARQAAEKRRKTIRTARNVGIAAAVIIGGIILINVLTGDDNKKDVAVDSSTTTTLSEAKYPAGCKGTKPASPAKKTDQKEPAMTIDTNKTYTATISTSCGDIVATLDAKNAPKGTNNFVTLAKQRFYDGLTWHRIVKGFVIQGGDPQGNGGGGPGYDAVTELPKDGYPLGTLAYAKTGTAPAGSAGSQFFVVTSDRPASLEQKKDDSYQYGVFGHVTKGIEVAKKIESLGGSDEAGTPKLPVYINKVTISES